ncbi:hypothetical protein BH24GEM3_BH24GEM3_01410 [soil metagenome]
MRAQLPGRALLILLLLTASQAHAAQAQEVGAFASAGWSEQTELPHPRGYGVFLTTPSLGFFALRLSYDEQESRSERQETVCDSYWPSYTNCTQERVRSDVTLRSLRLGVLARVDASSRVRLGLGGGRSLSRVNADIRGKESGRTLGLVMPEDRQHGSFLLVTADLQRILGTPLFLSSTASGHTVRFDGCATDSYIPFCGTQTITELQLGLGYRF